jgi:predicted TPR repeat methyltransferase
MLAAHRRRNAGRGASDRIPQTFEGVTQMAESQLQRGLFLQQTGRIDEAAVIFRELLRINPSHFEAMYSLGLAQVQMGQAEEGQNLMGGALRLNPRFAEGWCARGIVLLQLQRREEAIVCFDRALALRPGFADAIASRATALLESGRSEEALAEFDRVLAMNPGHAIGWNNRGNALVALSRHEEAIPCFDKALALQPDLETATVNRELALLELRKLNRLPPNMTRALFDDFSPYYDSKMLDVLGYRGHLLVRAMAEKAVSALAPPMRILDLGCGTGLVGDAFKDIAAGGRLDGIDLSPRMIEAARARGIYDDLILGDLDTVLAQEGRAYDLILAADTIIYIGDLGQTFAGVLRRLTPGGFFVFTCERKDGGHWEQTEANRFRHSEAYLREEARRAGFEFAEFTQCELRNESSKPVAGFAAALRKPVTPNARPSSA